MPRYKYGDMFEKLEPNNNLFVITTNSFIKKDGCLVMGRGAAKKLSDRFSGIAKFAGKYIAKFKKEYKHEDYLFFTLKYEHRLLGFLQVKRFFKENSDLRLIRESIGHMNQFVETAPWIKEINMNYPGIGYGGLEKKAVKPLLKVLGKRFVVWQYEK